MEIEQIVSLIQAVSDSKLTSFTYEKDGVKLKLGCDNGKKIIVTEASAKEASAKTETSASEQQPKSMAMNTAPQASVEENIQGNVIKSPLVGTFYATPSEDGQPFVNIGDMVKKGQTLAIVEAMKLMNDIESDFDGKVAEIYVKSGDPVEYGQPLFRIA